MKIEPFFSTTFRDPDDAAATLSSTYAQTGIEPLNGSAFDLQVSVAVTPAVQVYRSFSATGLHFLCGERFEGFNINRMVTGQAHSRSGDRLFVADAEKALLTDAREVDCNTVAAGSINNGIALPLCTLQTKLSQFIGREVSREIRFSRTDLSNGLAQGCEAFSGILFDGLKPGGFLVDNPLAVANMEDAIYSTILFGAEHNYSAALANGQEDTPRLVRFSIDYMEAHAHLPVTTADIANALGTNLRTLQLAFRRYLDTTPNAYMRGVRLENAHRDLRDHPGLSVNTIARKWGFNASGEFARLYFNRFGEKPTDTRR